MKEDLLVIENKITLKKELYFIIKRFFDIVISIIGLLFFIPFTLIIKIIYVLSGDFNKIIFKHERIGKNGIKFNLYKYRTMVPDADIILKDLLKDPKIKKEWKENHKLNDDPRITKIGKILRLTSLDEIPQMINILKGEMSFIGPRPMIKEEVDDYKENKGKLLSIKPGLTGWWACNGRSSITSEERKKLELFYVDNCKISLDIKIIFLTIVKVLKREGVK